MMDRSKYPPDWKAISKRIREQRAGGRCECTGQCDLVHRGGRCNIPNGIPIGEEGKARVILTVAHLCHDSACSNETHLIAACQRCHLRIDRYQHAKNAAATRRRKADQKSGQLALLGEE